MERMLPRLSESERKSPLVVGSLLKAWKGTFRMQGYHIESRVGRERGVESVLKRYLVGNELLRSTQHRGIIEEREVFTNDKPRANRKWGTRNLKDRVIIRIVNIKRSSVINIESGWTSSCLGRGNVPFEQPWLGTFEPFWSRGQRCHCIENEWP